MAQYIVDFQAFKDDCNNFVLKEISIVSVHSHIFTHCIIRPPFPIEELSAKKKCEVKWLTRNHHGIKWKEGYVNPDDAILMLLETTKDASLILSKGSERTKFLNKLTKKLVLDLNEIQCPPAKYLPVADSYFLCMFHKHSMKNIRLRGYVCSVLSTFRYKSWYLEYLANYSDTLIKHSNIRSNTKEDEYHTAEK